MLFACIRRLAYGKVVLGLTSLVENEGTRSPGWAPSSTGTHTRLTWCSDGGRQRQSGGCLVRGTDPMMEHGT